MISFPVTKLSVDHLKSNQPSESNSLYITVHSHMGSHVNMPSLIDFVSNLRVPLGMRLRGSSLAITPGMASYHPMR